MTVPELEYPLLIWAALPPARQRQGRVGSAHTDRCALPGCERRRASAAGLCLEHWTRLRDGLDLTLPSERAGARPSGYGVYGVAARDETGILCHECGRWLRFLTAGHLRGHELTPSEYRVKHGLSKTEPLCCLGYSAAHRTKLLARPDITSAGAARLTALAHEGSAAAAAALSRDGVAPAAAARRARGLQAVTRPRGRRPCPVCGGSMPSGESARKLTVCSRECDSESKRRGAWKRHAARAGEDIDFARTQEALPRVDIYAVAARNNVTIRSVTRWIRLGQLRIHDGRSHAVPWWYDRDLPRTTR